MSTDKRNHTAQDFRAVTPSDSVDFGADGKQPRAIYVGGDGSVAAVRPDGTVVTFSNCVHGEVLPISPRRINATGTTATNLIALY